MASSCVLAPSRATDQTALCSAPTAQWLDEGGGKDLDLEECPRKRLESERITYLNAEQREVYRVTVSDDGLLVWAKDGKTVLDTTKYHEDRGPEHGGIVAISEAEYEEKQRKEDEKLKEMQERGEVDSDLSRSSSSSSSSSDEADEIREGVKAYGDKVRSPSFFPSALQRVP